MRKCVVTPASTSREVIHRSSDLFPYLWITLWVTSGQSYFHCVETPKPPAMKPKPTTMFQLPSALIGRSPSVT